MDKHDPIPFNPLDYENLGVSISNAILNQDPGPLRKLERFGGAGLYVLYYSGSTQPFPAYQAIIDRHKAAPFSEPIYIGKAVPSGSRKGGRTDKSAGTPLFNRLIQHLRSIEQAKNLDVSDFYVRFLVVDDVWIGLGESILIDRMKPLWNYYVDGFGNHDPGRNRGNTIRSMWDTIHPSREFATSLATNRSSSSDIEEMVAKVLRGAPVPTLADEKIIREADSDTN